MKRLAFWIAVASFGTTAYSQLHAASQAAIYEGGRLIIGDGSTAIEGGAFVVQNGHITGIGRQGAVTAPPGATHVDLTGKTVMPAMINVHVHIGYEGYTSWGAENYTPQNVLDHLQREAFYGTAVTQSVGTSPTDASIQFQRDQQVGKFPPASRFFFMPGMAPPNGGPDFVLRKATTALHVVNEVSNAQEARVAVQTMADKKIKNVKIWVDDRRGTYPKMTPEVYQAIIDEAHKHQMIIHAHATTLPDQKAVVRAGVDVLVHMVQNEKLDDEYPRAGDCYHSCHDGAATIGAELRPPLSECTRTRGNSRLQFSEDDRVGGPHRARNRYRNSAGTYIRLGGACRTRAMGAAGPDALRSDHGRNPAPSGSYGTQRYGDTRRR
jgi:hypothetical protein